MSDIVKLILKQNIGVKNTPVIKIGDKVKKGSLIAKAEGMGADLHSSVFGTVSDITEDYIEIKADKVQPDEFVPIPDKGSIAEKVKASGLVGMGGAGFPTHIKLGTVLKDGVVICNAAECEPLLEHNIYQITKNPKSIYEGIKYSMESTGASRGVLAIKGKHEEAIKAFESVIEKGSGVEVFLLEDLYPMGEERAIIREVLGVLLKTDELPSAASAIVLNAETVSRIYEAVSLNKPVISKNITMVGKMNSGENSKVVMEVPIGTPIKDLINKYDMNMDKYGEIIIGGPFTGHSANLDDVITKTSGGIIVTMEFMQESRDMGLLVCACGGNEVRLREIAEKMGAPVVAVEKCKQAIENKGTLKCENPGNCPGQAEKILSLRKKGAKVLLISNCSDCSNTVMCVAPKLKMPVYHCTDHVMRTVGHSLIRRLK